MTDSPILDYLIKLRIPRKQWPVAYLEMAYGEIPESITAEELGEVVPAEIREDIELYFEKAAGGVQ